MITLGGGDMKIAERIGWLAGGIVTGAVLTGVLIGAVPLPFTGSMAGPVLEQLPSRVVARILLGRTADAIVADSRGHTPIAHGVTFYDQPTAAGSFFCLVRLYSVPWQVVAGQSPDRGLGHMEISKAYGLWIDPSEVEILAADVRRDARTRACEAYRDFENLIAERDALAASAGLQFLAAARDAVRGGETLPEINCISRREERAGRPCDGQALLHSINLRSVRWAETVSNYRGQEEAPWRATYKLTLDDGDVHGHPALTDITISGRHLPGMGVDSIQSVTIEREVY